VSTILDQVTSQENVVRAEGDLIAARYDYQLARAELESLIGRDL
jgi:outer membrane protein